METCKLLKILMNYECFDLKPLILIIIKAMMVKYYYLKLLIFKN